MGQIHHHHGHHDEREESMSPPSCQQVIANAMALVPPLCEIGLELLPVLQAQNATHAISTLVLAQSQVRPSPPSLCCPEWAFEFAAEAVKAIPLSANSKHIVLAQNPLHSGNSVKLSGAPCSSNSGGRLLQPLQVPHVQSLHSSRASSRATEIWRLESSGHLFVF